MALKKGKKVIIHCKYISVFAMVVIILEFKPGILRTRFYVLNSISFIDVCVLLCVYFDHIACFFHTNMITVLDNILLL